MNGPGHRVRLGARAFSVARTGTPGQIAEPRTAYPADHAACPGRAPDITAVAEDGDQRCADGGTLGRLTASGDLKLREKPPG